MPPGFDPTAWTVLQEHKMKTARDASGLVGLMMLSMNMQIYNHVLITSAPQFSKKDAHLRHELMLQ
jgi:hypothetical protein